MARIAVRGTAIVDLTSFHEELKRAFRFFDGYGRNSDAWIDCMTDLHGPDALSGLALAPEEQVEIVLVDSAVLAHSHPEILELLGALVTSANERYRELNSSVRITLIEA